MQQFYRPQNDECKLRSRGEVDLSEELYRAQTDLGAERTQPESTEQNSKQQHQAILQTAMDGFCRLDAQGRLLEANETYCRMSGYGVQELLSMRVSDLEADDTAVDISARIKQITRQGQIRFESRHRRKDGTLFDVEISAQHWPGAEKELVVFIRDITERKLAGELFQGVFENNTTSIQILDKKGRTVKVNAAFMDLFGSVPPADYSVFDDLGKRPALKKLVAAAKSGNVTHFPDIKYNAREVEPEVPDKPVWVRATIFPLNGRVDRREHFVLIHENITETKRMEDELLQISNLERERIGQDLHDTIGQHLVGMAYLVDVLEMKLAESNPLQAAAAKRISALCKTTHAQLRTVVRGLLPIDANAGLPRALKLLAENVREQMGIACESRCTFDAAGLDSASIGQLFRLAQEAVANAARHGHAKKIIITLEQVGERVELRIDDDGKGIWQTPSDDSGLGLKTMRYRADMVQGELSVTRNEGKGTSVRCTFDMAPSVDSFDKK